MASSSSINHGLQSPINCHLCDGLYDVDSYCLGCKGNLCSTCKISHTQVRMFKSHKIIPIIQGLKLQAAEQKCSSHPSYICSFYCNICQNYVCNKCITNEHRGHDISEIESVLQEGQWETMETRYLAQCKQEVAKIKRDIRECKKVTMSVKSKINDKRTEVITVVNGICDDFIQKAEDEKKCHILDMEKTLQSFQDKIKEIEQLMTKRMQAPAKLLSNGNQFNQEKPSLANIGIQKVATKYIPTFTPGRVDISQIAQQIGNLKLLHVPQKSLTGTDIDVSIVQRNKLEKGIRSINVVNANHSWVNEPHPGESMMLVNTDGGVIKRIVKEFVIEDFLVTTYGEIIATDYDGMCINTMTESGQVISTINTNPFHPSGICLGNDNQDIVACVNTPDISNSKLAVYSRNGKGICTINYTDKRVGEYFVQRIVQNTRGDYCVAHWGHHKVYVMDSNGAIRYTYDGSAAAGKMEKDMFPYDICSDIYNSLFISDYFNHNIHMLDDDGNFLRLIVTNCNGITKPTGLCIGMDGNMWVGQINGGLSIVKYLK